MRSRVEDLQPCPSSPHLSQNRPCDLINTENINPSFSTEENLVHPLTSIHQSHVSLPERSSAVTDDHSVSPSLTPLSRLLDYAVHHIVMATVFN